jgi:hypothetical protein
MLGSEAHQREDPHFTLYKTVADGGCVACGHHPIRLYEGPRGGMSINVFCGDCGQGYNIAPELRWAELIHKDERYITKERTNAKEH